MLPFLLSMMMAVATPEQAAGKLSYETRCASCHGMNLRGGVNAPSLLGAGAADVDFHLVTGRMPAAVPWVQVGHRGQQISTREVRVLEAYIALVAPGGPPIPEIATSGNLEHGRVLFTQNCQHCHGVDAGGASIGDSAEWAPSLHAASITQVAEAVRVGPGYMPKFAPSQLDDPALGDLATYVISLDTAAATGAFPLNSGGPVPEGLYGWLAAGFLALLGYTFSKRSGRTPVDDSEPGEERE